MAQPTATPPVLDTETRAHHPYSPSSLQSVEACPCFKSRESKHLRTIIGTISHKVTETREDDNRLDDDDAAAAAECLDFYDTRVRGAMEYRSFAVAAVWKTLQGEPGADTLKAEAAVPQIIEMQETYLPVDDIKFDDGVEATTAGFVDRVLIAHTREYAELFDWKFGMWPVEKAENNLQGISYTLGLLRKYPTLKEVRFFFKQPNTGQISDAVFTRDMVAGLYLRIQTVVALARKARALTAKGDYSMANPMVPNCNFCANIADCTKVLDIALKVGKKFYPLEIPEDITPTAVHNGRDGELGMRLSGVMAVWAKAYRTRTTDRVIRGDAACPDGHVIQQRADREVVDPKLVRKIALKYLSKDEYESLLPQEPPFGPMEELISDKAVRGNKKATIEEFQKQLLDSGAVRKGDPYTFLRAVAKKD